MHLGGRCNPKNVVYQACISPMEHNNYGERVYIGVSAGNCITTDNTFSNLRFRNQPATSKYFWNFNDLGLTPQIKWKIQNIQPRIASMVDVTCVSMKKLVELILKIADYC